MKRIRQLGLLACVALALTMVAGVATASATSGFEASEYPATIDMSPQSYDLEITLPLGTVASCEVPYVSTKISKPVRKLVPTFFDVKCMASESWGGGYLHMSSCAFEFIPSEGTGHKGAVGLCKPLTLEFAECTFTYAAPQTGPTAEYLPITGAKKMVEIVLSGTLKYSRTGKGCKLLSEFGTSYFNAAWRAEAINEANAGLDLSVTDKLPLGLFLSSGKLEAEEYPVNVYGEQDPKDPFILTLPSAPAACEVSFNGGEIAAPTSALSLKATYGEWCTGTIYNKETRLTQITMESCHYGLDVLNAAMDITCGEGEGITAKVYKEGASKPICKYFIGPQTGLKGIYLETVGTGSGRKVAAHFNTSPVVERIEGSILNCGGKKQQGAFTGSISLGA